MRWFWQASDRRRYARFKADVPAIASLIGDRDIVSLRTRCESISEGGIGTPRLESLALGDLVTSGQGWPWHAAARGRFSSPPGLVLRRRSRRAITVRGGRTTFPDLRLC
jgi:hypothetical protein